MLYVSFTHSPDGPLFHLAASRILTLDPDATIVAVTEEASPLPPACLPPGVIQRSSSFDRSGNLNGLACIEGMLRTMADLCLEFDSTHIIKFDADLWANNLTPFLTSTGSDSFDYLATERWHFAQPAGYIYRLSSRLCERLLAEIASRRAANLFPPNNKYPEDQTIYALALQVRAAACLIPFTSGASTGLTDCSPDQLATALAADVVHCGEPLPDGSRAPRLTVLGRMSTISTFSRGAGQLATQ